MKKNICIHGHFYQPPRENAWLEEVERQDSAYPYHDWNAKITAECYAPNAAARIVDKESRIIDIINNYSLMSFNFAPTLLSWLKKNDKEVYNSIIEADAKSQTFFSGHGSAIAQCYNHMIMPLANTKDKKTQILWGLKDFEYHFKRKSEGMWLPETAVDDETLDIMSENNIKFVILSPFQAKQTKPINKKEWKDVTGGKIDPRLPYLYRLPSGRTIVIFFYDGKISQEIAYSNLLSSGDILANRLIDSLSNAEGIGNIAVDGETFGHHKHFGDMALAYCFQVIKNNPQAEITIYGAFLEKFLPKNEVQIYQNSAWSCAHGVGRWSRDCGCCVEHKNGLNQQWREHLRKAMDYLRDELINIYQNQMVSYTKDPWHIRDLYIEIILNRSESNIDHFFEKYFEKKLNIEEKTIILKLLEIQRHAMLMYTSCGWFFDDISGIETLQILTYAARAIQLTKEICQISLEEKYLSILEKAKSFYDQTKNGKYIYQNFVKPKILDLTDVSIDYIISTLFEKTPSHCNVFSYSITTSLQEVVAAEKMRLSFGKAEVFSHITLDRKEVYFIALHYFSHNIRIGITEKLTDDSFLEISKKVKSSFLERDLEKVKNQIEAIFTFHHYNFWNLFIEDQRKILKNILLSAMSNITLSIHNVHQLHYPLIKDMKDRMIPIPQPIVKSLDLILNVRLTELLKNSDIDLSSLEDVVSKILYWSFQIDMKTVTHLATKKLELFMERFAKELNVDLLKDTLKLFEILSSLSLTWSLWKVQNIYFFIDRSDKILQKADPTWMDLFNKLGELIKVKLH